MSCNSGTPQWKNFIPVSGLWDLNKMIVEELLYFLVFGVLEVKDKLDKTGRKKMAKNCMHWNVAPDVPPGSATFVCVVDRWLN